MPLCLLLCFVPSLCAAFPRVACGFVGQLGPHSEPKTLPRRCPPDGAACAGRFQKNKTCPEGEECRYAHGQDELTEWLDRREVLKQKLAKARKDMLLCPRDDDFGKYNFLLRDGV